VIEPLIQPERHGSNVGDAFHLVIPSLPGVTLSGPTPDTGWTEERIAAAFVTLMHRLGYDRYGVQGGDSGAGICRAMGRLDPESVVGVHVNAAANGFIPWHTVESEERDSQSDLDRERLDRMAAWMAAETGYFTIQGTKPETLASTGAHAGGNHWSNGTDQTATGVPTGVAVLKNDIAIQRYSEGANRITHSSDFETSGHFAAMETPDLLTGHFRAFFQIVQ